MPDIKSESIPEWWGSFWLSPEFSWVAWFPIWVFLKVQGWPLLIYCVLDKHPDVEILIGHPSSSSPQLRRRKRSVKVDLFRNWRFFSWIFLLFLIWSSLHISFPTSRTFFLFRGNSLMPAPGRSHDFNATMFWLMDDFHFWCECSLAFLFGCH